MSWFRCTTTVRQELLRERTGVCLPSITFVKGIHSYIACINRTKEYFFISLPHILLPEIDYFESLRIN